jgi:histidine ammonia-lyase
MLEYGESMITGQSRRGSPCALAKRHILCGVPASDVSIGQAVVAPLLLGEHVVDFDTLTEVALRGRPVRLSDAARAAMQRSRAAIEAIAHGGDEAPSVYGVNTGFGALAEVRIDADSIRELQRNLVRSHAAGVGQPLPTPIVRGMLLLRAAVLATGKTGVRPLLADQLCAMLDRGVHPIIPWQGSVGASGDLAPLAHLALVVIGEGEAELDGHTLPGAEALKGAGLEPVVLEAKEGLALVNGTQLMTAAGALSVAEALRLAEVADITGVMSLETIKGSRRPFDLRIAAARPHPGALATAQHLARLTADSTIAESHVDCHKVQDAYSFRCMPQVHGAALDGLQFARQVLEREMASVTDNPLVFVDSQGKAEILSGGNFHGQPVALALDYAAIAVAELAAIAERRIEQCLNPGLSGLSPFLAVSSGLHSGYMLAQVTAAALVSENKVLCHPASVDSIPSSAGREDHVSMGAHGAWKLGRVVENVRRVLAVEALCAARGLDLRAPLRPGPGIAAAHAVIRQVVPAPEGDRPLYKDIAAIDQLIATGRLAAAVAAAL